MNKVYIVLYCSNQELWLNKIVEKVFDSKELAEKYIKEMQEHLSSKYPNLVQQFENGQVFFRIVEKKVITDGNYSLEHVS